MAIIEYDKSLGVSEERRVQSLADSVRRAFDELDGNEDESIPNNVIDKICTPIGVGGRNVLPIASRTNLGCIRVGDGLNVRSDGTVWSEGVAMEAMTNTEIEAICR